MVFFPPQYEFKHFEFNLSRIAYKLFNFTAIQCDTCEEYKACGPSRQRTCGSQCRPTPKMPVDCVEGCFCPNNTVSHKGKCIDEAECPCIVDGFEYPAGSLTIKNCQKW